MVYGSLVGGVEELLGELQARQEQQRVEEEETRRVKKLRQEQVGRAGVGGGGVGGCCVCDAIVHIAQPIIIVCCIF